VLVAAVAAGYFQITTGRRRVLLCPRRFWHHHHQAADAATHTLTLDQHGLSGTSCPPSLPLSLPVCLSPCRTLATLLRPCGLLVAAVSPGYYQITPGRVAPCPRGTWKSAETANCTACVGAGVTTPGEAATSALNCSGVWVSDATAGYYQILCVRGDLMCMKLRDACSAMGNFL
jgi:hypothetical protein